MTTLLQGTRSLNNNGVQLFERELFLEAIDSFQLCLNQISEYQIEQEEFILMENMTNASDSGCEENKTRDHACDTVVTGGPSTSPFNGWSKSAKRSSSTEAGNPFLFPRTIRIREQEEPSHTEHRNTLMPAYKAALHYNLALTRHILLLLQRRSGEPPKVVLSGVTFLHRHYEAAYLEWKTLATVFIPREEHDLLDIRLLGLALFNNMGVVFCSEQARFREAFECFKAACGVMYHLDDGCQALEDDEMYELSMNAFLVPSEACPAA